LQDFAKSQEENDEFVENYDQKFKELFVVAHSRTLSGYPNKKSFRNYFGEPIVIDKVKYLDGRWVTLWIYRPAVKFFDSDKVYLYFEDDGSLINYGSHQGNPEIQQ